MPFFQKKQNEEPQNIDEVLAQFTKLKNEFELLRAEMKDLKAQNASHIGKVAITRFNPFDGLGGNQSFCLALLDNNDNGAVITSLFSREANRVYAKPLENGASSYPLSDEEKKTIELAQSKNHI